MATFVTTATGSIHRECAQLLDKSFERFGWPDLLVVTETHLPEVRLNLVVEDTSGLWGGRGLKTNWASFLPDEIEGEVFFIDSDCLAIGAYEEQTPLPPNSFQATRVFNLPVLQMERWNSSFLRVSDVHLAKRFCEEWSKGLTEEFTREGEISGATDEWVFTDLTKQFNFIAMEDSVFYPFPNLIHRGINLNSKAKV